LDDIPLNQFPTEKDNHIKRIKPSDKIYKSHGLPVSSKYGDNEFVYLRDDIGSIHLDIVAPNIHVPEIESSNQNFLKTHANFSA